ncbi:MAG: hypothetical protein MUE44_28680 [Oscillatoriaceae cyanobacterium Prado104]|nr:hypothetical protein [Oscillatoriaceae cyanobacterium Prado104]
MQISRNLTSANKNFHNLEGRRKKEEGRRKKEEGRGKKEEGRRKREEGRRKKEEGRRFVGCAQLSELFAKHFAQLYSFPTRKLDTSFFFFFSLCPSRLRGSFNQILRVGVVYLIQILQGVRA